MREQLGKMTGEDQENYGTMASGRWKKIQEDLVRLIAYNKKNNQMRDKTGNIKPTKSIDV